MIHPVAHPVNESAEDPVNIGQILPELVDLRPGVAAPLVSPLVGEENSLVAGGGCTPHHLFIPGPNGERKPELAHSAQ